MTITNTEGLSELPDDLARYIRRATEMSEDGVYAWWSRLAALLTELQSRRAANSAGRVEVKAVAFINAQGGVLMTEAGEEWFKTVRAMTAPAGLPAVPLFASSVSAEVTGPSWPPAPDGWLVGKPSYVRKDGKISVEYCHGAEHPWQVRLSHGNGASHSISEHDFAETALLAALNGGRENG